AGVSWVIPYLIVCPVYFFLYKSIRKSNTYTVSQILENKYGSIAKMIGFFVTLVAFVGICSYQYRGLAFVLNITTGLPVDIGTIVGAIIIIIIAMFGGLFSVAYTDAIGAFLIVITCLLSVPFALQAGGGWSNIAASVEPIKLTFSGGRNIFTWIGGYLPLIILLIGDQNFYQRMSAAKSDKAASIGAIGWMALTTLSVPCVGLIAFIGSAMFGKGIQAGMSFMSMTTVIPTFIGGILLAAASAFILTTGTSYLLSGATNITYDFYITYINKNASDKQILLVTRWATPVLGVLAYIILQFFPSILAIQNWSYTMIGAGLTSAIVGALIWPRVTKAAGLTSMILGSGTTLIWEMLGTPFKVSSAIVAFPVALISLIVVTLLTSSKDDSLKVNQKD
ncbi:MAG: sodium:solute symporter family protein, partial [Bacilli bacterium]|nr:sodium:solute symporter family protein [Bacilli bacterium]